MLSAIRRLVDRMRKAPAADTLQPMRPRVTPDAEAAAELERRRASVNYQPEFKDTLLMRRFER